MACPRNFVRTRPITYITEMSDHLATARARVSNWAHLVEFDVIG